MFIRIEYPIDNTDGTPTSIDGEEGIISQLNKLELKNITIQRKFARDGMRFDSDIPNIQAEYRSLLSRFPEEQINVYVLATVPFAATESPLHAKFWSDQMLYILNELLVSDTELDGSKTKITTYTYDQVYQKYWYLYEKSVVSEA